MSKFRVEPCDVFLHIVEGDSLLSKLERWAVGNFNHVSMFIGPAFGNVPFLVESDGRGAVIQSLQHKTGQLVLVMRPGIATADKGLLITQAIKLASDDNAYYDYLAIVRSCIPRVLWEKFPFLPIPPRYIRDQMMICSEAIAEIFWRSGFDVLPKNIVPLPADFLHSLLLSPVAEGRIMEDILPWGFDSTPGLSPGEV